MSCKESALNLTFSDLCYRDIYSTSFPGDSDGKESTCIAGDPSSIPGSGISSGEGNGYPLEYSCLENSMARGAWQATVYGVIKRQTWLANPLLVHTLYTSVTCTGIS